MFETLSLNPQKIYSSSAKTNKVIHKDKHEHLTPVITWYFQLSLKKQL